MKYLRKFDSVEEMNTAAASSEIGFIGLAYDGSTPVLKNKPTPPDPKTIPFYIEDISGRANTIQIKKYSSAPTLTIEKSTDGVNWTEWGETSTTEISATVPANGRLYLRCSAAQWASGGDSKYNYFNSASGNFNVGGNINSLLYGSSFNGQTEFPSGVGTYTFNYLFKYSAHMISAEQLLLPATTLADRCYSNMFYNCTSLTTAPALPATTLANNCYYTMFSSCTSLTSAPVLPATTLAQDCYNGMFSSCTSLTSAPVLPATTLANSCYSNMFYGCTSLTTAPALPVTTLASSCYAHMFNGCTALTTAPALPATTLTSSCYISMFYGCTSLTTAPALPATTLTSYCYRDMFNGCTSLNYIKCLATDISASNCIYSWVNNVASTGTFVKDQNMTGWTTGVNGIPSGWTVQNA